MLTPSTRATIRPRSLSTPAALSTPATTRIQARTLVGSHRSFFASYDSHLDPLYPRFVRHGGLKSRAKLLKTVRRRQQSEWDADLKPIVGQKQVRYASHWGGNGRSRWPGSFFENEDNQNKRHEKEYGSELSEREKAWEKQIEAMRKRIESDPYEAVFGKRFEPFWSALVRKFAKEDTQKDASMLNAARSNKVNEFNEAIRKRTAQLEQMSEKYKKAAKSTRDDDAGKQPQSYAYSSSTSWDSKTNKTRKSEWDSVSNKTKNYEYDPVSGRMVPVEAPKTIEGKQQQEETPAGVTWKPTVDRARSSTKSASNKYDNVDIPVKTLKSTEKRTPVQPVVDESQAKNKPAVAEKDDISGPRQAEVDELTAGDVRAAMGKSKGQSFDQRFVSDQWKSEREDLRQQIKEWDDSVTRLRNKVTAIVDETSATALGQYLPTTLDRRSQKETSAVKARPLQPSIQRMQSKPEPEPVDPDDSAAHESTEPIPTSTVPKDWSEQADILQSDRIKRVTMQQPLPRKRWLDEINNRKANYEKSRALADAEQSAAEAEKTQKLEKANAILKAEVDAQKLAMGEQQDRSTLKIKTLRTELETAYKQSSVHADAFRDRIASLEKELSNTKNTANEVNVKAIKERYSDKVRHLQKELERAYKQSSVHADEFTRRIKSLEAELVSLTEATGATSGAQSAAKEGNMKAMQGEGDFCPRVMKFAESEMWYKQPSSPLPLSPETEAKLVQKRRDRELVNEVQAVYESSYGTIDAQHQQPKTVLDEALAKHDKRAAYGFKEDGLEAELSGKADKSTKPFTPQDTVAYGFKEDGLEAELSGKADKSTKAVPLQDTVAYGFREDGLEAELSGKADKPKKLFTPQDPVAYGYKDDGLEAQLKRPLDVPEQTTYAYKADSLEAELKQQSQPGTAEETESRYAYKADGLESELQAEKVSSTSLGARFEPDGLESELKSQSVFAVNNGNGERFEPDGLEAELKKIASQKPEYASDEYEAEAAKIPSMPHKVTKMEKTMASSLGAELQAPVQSSPSVEAPASSGVQWQHPPEYKVVAYDSGNDRFTTATTTSWDHSVQEAAITIPQALRQLYQPARWTQHFANLQREGYQVVDAREDVLVLKKVQDAGKPTGTPSSPSKIKPFENISPVNPVDGTSRSNTNVRPVTGDYASPTGFVNLDLMQELASKLDNSSKPADRPTPAAHTDRGDLHATYQDFPRIRREESVFSGTNRVRSKSRGRRAEKQRQNQEQEQSYEKPYEKPTRSSWKWAVAGMGLLSGTMYGVGSVAEKAKAVRLEKEAALREGSEAEKAGSQARWRLDEGQWKGK
ncbi:hypothetical protein Q7P37_009542 [Cladosporium fusiforme]